MDMTLQRVAEFFMESRDWNGLPAHELPKDKLGPDWLAEQIDKGLVEIQDARVVLNAHIRRLSMPVSVQLKCLDEFDVNQICVYPTEKLLRSLDYGIKIDSAPVFVSELYKGAAQLDFKYFNLPVIDRYMQDPRYVIHWGSTQGSISIKDKYINDPSLPESAKCVIQSFGLGSDVNGVRVVCSFLRYLAKLDPDHQMYWKSYMHPVKASPVKPYYQTSLLGIFPESISVIRAIKKEMEIINHLLMKHVSVVLFRPFDDPDEQPHYLTSFIKPTKYDFDTFSAALEQATIARTISDAVDPYKSNPKYGSVHGLKGLVRHFVGKHSVQEDLEYCLNAIDDIVNARKGVSHKIGVNDYSAEYDTMRRDLNEKVYNAFRILRNAIELNFSDQVKDPFLDEWKIHNY